MGKRSICAGIASLALPACGLLFDPSELSTGGAALRDASDDAPDSGETEDLAWGCLGRVVNENEDRTMPVDLRFSFMGFLGDPLVDMPVKLCRFIDVGCQSPLGSFVTDAEGSVLLPLYMGFRGYLDIGPSEAQPDLLPTLLNLPLLNEQRAKSPHFFANLGTKQQLTNITQQAEKPADPELGYIGIIASDCQGALAADVTPRLDPMNEEAYSFFFDQNGTPSLTQEKTSSNGNGGFINVAPGVVGLIYEHDGQRVGEQNVIVRPGTITYVSAEPTP